MIWKYRINLFLKLGSTIQTLFFPDDNGKYIPLMFTGFVSYSSKANLGKKITNQNTKTVKNRHITQIFPPSPKNLEFCIITILCRYGYLQKYSIIRRREDIFIQYCEINLYQFKIQNVTQLHMYEMTTLLINQSMLKFTA